MRKSQAPFQLSLEMLYLCVMRKLISIFQNRTKNIAGKDKRGDKEKGEKLKVIPSAMRVFYDATTRHRAN